MINSTALPVVPGGVGLAVVTSDLAARKTIIVTGIEGTVDIEASADGLNFCSIASMKAPSGHEVVVVAATHMRVLATGANASSVNIIAERGRIRSGAIPPPPADGPGESIDISDFGSITSLYVEKGNQGTIDIEISGDDINFVAPFKSFNKSGCITEDISTRFIRAVGNGATATVRVASEEPAARALNSPAPAFVFRPGAIPGGNVYDSWPPLVAAMSSVEGRKILEFDDSIVTPCVIPQGIWAMKNVMWAGFGPRSNPGVFRAVVDITEGAVFTGLRMIGGQITIRNKATATPPVSDFGAGTNHVHIGLRDDCGTAQFMNLGTAPMFDLGDKPVSFFIQNCLFGIGSTSHLIRQTGGNCTLFLLGLNQTGANVVESAPGASVVFNVLSNSATIGEDQSSITDTGGKYTLAPLGRLQLLLLPLPPLPPATVPQTIIAPNTLVLCDGSAGFTQLLPQIVGGFTILGVVRYTGGQEVIVAEVRGGSNLVVAPHPGDTIDGAIHPVPIAGNGSRTFISDGVSNWITTSAVP